MRRRLGSIAIIALLLAGCLGGNDDGGTLDAASQQPSAAAGVVAENQTEAPDGRGKLAAFEESNATVSNGTGAMDHKHDYWGGAERKVIGNWAGGLIPIPLVPEGKAPGTAIADFDLPAPNLVYEGTGQVEVLFTDVALFPFGFVGDAAPPHPAITIFVDYLTAADEPGQWRQAGQAKPDEPLVIPVEPTQADMPHQTKSLWVFRVYTGEANAFTFNMTFTAVKGRAVVDWPPHPDLYRDNAVRTVFEGDVVGKYDGDAANFLYGSDANWVYPERIISYGTERVEVIVTRNSWEGPAPEPKPEEFELQFVNASYIPKVGNGDPAGGHLAPAAVDGSTYRFDVPVDAQGYDTPYGTASRWGFRFMPTSTHGLPWSQTYHLTVTAYGHSIEETGDGPDGARGE